MTPAAGYPPQAGGSKRNRTRILLAFGAVYFLWGSTYLAIRYSVETIPPFLMGATRFLVAGVILYAVARWRGADAPTRSEWRNAAITGLLMLSFGNGSVIWAEQTLPSGIAALIVAAVPLWIVLVDWLRPRGVRPRGVMFVGVGIGLAGIAILVGPRAEVGRGEIDKVAAGVLMLGSLCWAIGSIVTRRAERPRSALVFTALQMIVAGVAFSIMAIMFGEPRSFALSAVSVQSLVGWLYLIVFGSLIGYTAYIYLLGAVSAAKAATYAYVNPVIAVLLGWAFANERIGPRTLVAAAVILAGVAIITATQSSTGQSTGEYPVSTEASQRSRSAA
jgi:drug/metabolite transporter (DMT)-like permease